MSVIEEKTITGYLFGLHKEPYYHEEKCCYLQPIVLLDENYDHLIGKCSYFVANTDTLDLEKIKINNNIIRNVLNIFSENELNEYNKKEKIKEEIGSGNYHYYNSDKNLLKGIEVKIAMINGKVIAVGSVETNKWFNFSNILDEMSTDRYDIIIDKAIKEEIDEQVEHADRIKEKAIAVFNATRPLVNPATTSTIDGIVDELKKLSFSENVVYDI